MVTARAHVVGEEEVPMRPLPEGGGTSRVAIDAAAGCRNLLQRILRVEPGRTGTMRQERSEDVLYLAEGRARVEAGERSFDLEPGGAVLVPPGTPYAIENVGPEEALLISVLSPQPGQTGPAPGDGAEAASVREQDQEVERAGTERYFRVLIDPRHGCRSVTQFVGSIDQSRAPLHAHTYEEAIYILDGEGVVHVEGREVPIRRGSSVFLSPGTPHCLENRSGDVLRLLGVFSPPGSPAAKMMD